MLNVVSAPEQKNEEAEDVWPFGRANAKTLFNRSSQISHGKQLRISDRILD
jgi:hypothetical protein